MMPGTDDETVIEARLTVEGDATRLVIEGTRTPVAGDWRTWRRMAGPHGVPARVPALVTAVELATAVERVEAALRKYRIGAFPRAEYLTHDVRFGLEPSNRCISPIA